MQKNFFQRIPIYPILLTLWPVVSLYALNSWMFTPIDLLRPGAIHLAFGLITLAICRLLTGSNRTAALLSCVPIIAMLAFGYAFQGASAVFGSDLRESFFAVGWLALALILFLLFTFVLRHSQNSFRKVTEILNTFAGVLFVLSLLPLVLASLSPNPSDTGQSRGSENPVPVRHEWLSDEILHHLPDPLPDVYFIILDSYAREDVLDSRFGFDNSEFLEWLKGKGFFVARSSHSNYPWTHLSLSATLNSEYLQTLLPEELLGNLQRDSADRSQFVKQFLFKNFIHNSRVHRLFSALGFRINTDSSSVAVRRDPHRYLAEALLGPVSILEETLLSRTVLRSLIFQAQDISLVRRLELTPYYRTTAAINSLTRRAFESGPKFVFSHIMSPHPPFSFDADGNPAAPRHLFSHWTAAKRALPGYQEWFRQKYPEDVTGLNLHMQPAIQKILDASRGNAIIIIQSDHGPPMGLYPQSAEQSDLVERFGILNAIYLPPGYSREGLHDHISSINTFTVVLNSVFGLQLQMLKDRAYFSDSDLNFIEVTERITP
jgi:hypothetical protein